MPRATKSWTEKRDGAHAPHVDVLDKPFGGAPAGARMLISSPQEIAAFIDAIPRGETRTVAEMRQALARAHRASVTCPLTTGIFTRIVAEAALEERAAGKARVTPFWRVVDPDSPLAAKLSCGAAGVRQLRAADGGP